VHGTTLGLIHLGETRVNAENAYGNSPNRGHGYEDFFCVAPNGVRVGYPSPALLRALVPADQRAGYRNHVIWISTADQHATLNTVHPGEKITAVGNHLKLEPEFEVGANDWYLAPYGTSTAVLKVRHGVIEEIGIADHTSTTTRAADRVFLRSFR
jgi:hypothetical protein